MARTPLKPKQERFCQEFLVDLDQAAAAKRAGFSPRSAHNTGSRLMKQANVRHRIQQLMDRRADRIEITQDNVLNELARVAFSNIQGCFTEDGHLLAVQDWPENVAASIASVEVVTSRVPGEDDPAFIEHTHKLKLWDKMNGLEKLGKHLKLFDRSQEADADEIARMVRARIASSLGLPTVPDE